MDQRNPHGLSPREQMATPMDAVVLMMNCLSHFIIAKVKSHFIKVVYFGEFV
jgi:D-alanyl-D-alanine carboxypeptidase